MRLEPRAGWLTKDLTIKPDICGVFVPRWSILEGAEFPTRTEEIHFITNALNTTRRGVVVDAGCGYNRDIHVLDYCLGNLGYRVHAFDANPDVTRMPPHHNVFFNWADMQKLPLPNACADYWISLSVLEHVTSDVRARTLQEANRVLKPGGFVLLTTDTTAPIVVNTWLAKEGRFEVGLAEDGISDLQPQVSWAIAQKPL